jgi:uncharacterized membrane-anchored protein YhcB (DUF1043 family)
MNSAGTFLAVIIAYIIGICVGLLCAWIGRGNK